MTGRAIDPNRAIVACDIGGTHARFCLASADAGSVPELGEPVTLRTADYASFAEALREFARQSGTGAVRDLTIAFAGPVGGEDLKLTNSSWVIRRDGLVRELGIERLTIVNDFGAVSHCVAALDDADFRHLCGPQQPLPGDGVISVIGPGTGLGAAILLRESGGRYRVIETEGGHIGFSPGDVLEDGIHAALRQEFGRVSVERLASGPGLPILYSALAAAEGKPAPIDEQKALWATAIDGSDPLAAAALEHFCRVLGAVAGDLALAQGAKAVVIAGGIGRRLLDHLPASGFGDRFAAKGRFRSYMEAMPVKLVTHAEPGLVGAAAAFAQEHC